MSEMSDESKVPTGLAGLTGRLDQVASCEVVQFPLGAPARDIPRDRHLGARPGQVLRGVGNAGSNAGASVSILG
jgi:hypothetical protein